MINVPERIKDLFHLDTCKKNIRIHFPNGERADICNDLIVKDTVKLTESLCSQEELKFGLCESPVFECEVVGAGNINGAVIHVFCEIYCDSSVTGSVWRNDLQAYVYPIPYGVYTVTESKRQADMIHRKIVAYNNVYNSIVDGGQSDSDMAFYAGRIVNSQSAFSTSIEELIFTTYPKLFDESQYNYTVSDLTDLSGYSGQVVKLHNGSLYNNSVYLIFYFASIISSNQEIGIVKLDEFERNPSFEEELNSAINDAAQYTDITAEELRELVFQTINNTLYMRNIPNIRLQREDYVSSDSVTTKTRKKTEGNAVIFPGRSAYVDNIKVCLRVGEVDLHPFLREINNLKPGTSFRYAVPLSELTSTPYSLERAKDRYDFGYFTSKGYSARLAYQALNIMNVANAYFETQGLFAMFERNGGTKHVNLKRLFDLTPQSDLYPGLNVYPNGTTGGWLLPDDYQKCWYDDKYTKPFGAIQCDYKNTDNESASFILYLSGYTSSTPEVYYRTYHVTGNAYIDLFTWTKAQIQTICETIASNVEGVQYMPVEFTGRGLPYVEVGDTFEILTKSGDSITTIVLNRTISGEQTLTDTYKSV